MTKRERDTAWRKANPDKARMATLAWREANAERVRLVKALWRKNNPEKVRATRRSLQSGRASSARWKKNNPEKHRAMFARWQKNNRERLAEYRSRRRARKANAPVIEKINRLDIAERGGWKCYLCAVSLTKRTLTLDHVVALSKKGEHSDRNLKACCRSCNSRKKDRQMLLFGGIA